MILDNKTKSLVIAGHLTVSKNVLILNRLDYIISAEMPSKEELSQKYISEIETAMRSRNDNYQGDLIDLFLSADPSPNRKYVVWIIKSYIRGGITRLEDLLSGTLPALQNFIILTNRKKLEKGDKPWENEYDINNYFGLRSGEEKNRMKFGLEDVIEKYGDFLESLKGKKETKEIVKENLVITFENDLATVYQPLTEEASCYVGKGTRWCTAADKNNMFESYSKKGPIFVIQPKNPKHPREKYQYIHEDEQYMDDKNEEVDPVELFERFGLESEIPKIKKIVIGIDKAEILFSKYPTANFIVKIEDITDLEEAKKYPIKSLMIRIPNLETIPDLSMFTDLESLSIPMNGLKSLKNIEKLPTLQKLSLSDNAIETIDNLDKLVSLKELDLSTNLITELKNLDKLTNLQKLDLSMNNVKIENLDKLTNLKELDLSMNTITEIKNLDKLTNLQKLNLSMNKITEIKNLDKLINLQELDLSKNKITEIKNLENLTNLEILELRNNQIKEIKNLENLTNLKVIYLKNNILNPDSDDTEIYLTADAVPDYLKRKGLGIYI
jgi:hypothetical protein